MAYTVPPLGFVRVDAEDPDLHVIARLNENVPTWTDGFGGWDVVERPRRAPLTSFKAPPARQMSLGLLLNRWTSGDAVWVEDACWQITQMGMPTAANGDPPQLRVTARGAGVPGQQLTWVVGSIDWGDKLVDDNGNRLRQALTLNLIQYVEDLVLKERSAANRQRAKAKAKKKQRGAKSKRMRVKTGRRSPDDLLSIAARELGDAERWPEIAELNGIRDPRSVKLGQVIRLP